MFTELYSGQVARGPFGAFGKAKTRSPPRLSSLRHCRFGQDFDKVHLGLLTAALNVVIIFESHTFSLIH